MKALTAWFDQRLGGWEFYRKHLAYPLPNDLTVWHVFGGLTIGVIMIQIITGVYMLFFYDSAPMESHQSIREMCNNTRLGAIFRNSHRWSCTLGILFLGIHMLHAMARKAYKAPRVMNWWTGLCLAVLYVLLLITGIIMPWDWRSYWELVIWADWLNTMPGLGGFLKGLLLRAFSHDLNYWLHILLLPAGILSLIMIHIILFRKHGPTERV
ncbi:MAG: cytochrome b N-terminal domain-containing protein [Nitrospinota bacterium]|nr:cytochrome b N-terminal domain-containing protein [Nitrospinota bacterium]